MRVSRYLASTAVLALVAAVHSSPSRSTETITYTYDALGRLVKAQSTGSVNSNNTRSFCLDPAGNRTQARVDSAGGVASCTGGTPTPTPPPGNQPPVANADSLTAPKCVTRSVNVTANDTDPEGNYPLALTAVNQDWAYVESGTTVGMYTPDTNGTYTITYTVADSLGATSTGYLTVTVSGSQQCV